MSAKLADIFKDVQLSTSCHQKYLKVLNNLYQSESFDDFVIEFMYCVDIAFREDIGANKEYVNRCLNFCSTFCSNLVATYEKELESQDGDDTIQTHPFLTRIIEEVLNYHDLEAPQARYHSCEFIALLLKNVGDDANLDNDLCDSIQDAMLDRIVDIKPAIRIQAANALLRLQDPTNPDCPVIKAYIQCMGDPSSMVRKEVVEKIGPCALSIGKVIERLRDVDYSVRSTAFMKCATMGPRILKITDRQAIILNGINEENKSVKKTFTNVLLPKWLASYDGNYIKFLNALKLDADDEDIKQTAFIHEKVMEVFFVSEPLKNIVEALPLGKDKVPLGKLTIEVVAYWFYLTNYLRSAESLEDYYDRIAPELVSLCNYIESFIKEKTSKMMDEWEYLEFQQILYKLFQIAGKSDFADEAGRRILHNLIIKTIIQTKLVNRVLTELIIILKEILHDVDTMANEICIAISEIREPLVDEGPSPELVRETNFKIAEINLKLNLLKDDQETAVLETDYQGAAKIQEEIVALEQNIGELKQKVAATEKVKQTQNDPETICRCLDILIILLQNVNSQKMPVSLRSYKDEFVMALSDSSNIEQYWRVLKCIVLYALLDKQFALTKLRAICSPIIIYRLTATYDKSTLMVCVGGISDLLRVHGPSLFAAEESVDTINSTLSKRRNGVRRLYRIAQMEDLESYDFENITSEDIIDVILDMLDDDLQEIRECATDAITKVVGRGLIASSSLVSRLLLKWFNPLTEKQDQRIQQTLGISIFKYARGVQGSADVLEKAIIPTLCSIGNAPKTSPLAEIDIDNVLQFLAAITRINRNEFAEVHKNLAYGLCCKIVKKPQDQCVPILTKMLLYLNEPANDQIGISELLKLAERCVKDVVENYALRNLNKYVDKLKGYSISQMGDTIMTTETQNPSSRNATLPMAQSFDATDKENEEVTDDVNNESVTERSTQATADQDKQNQDKRRSESVKRRKERRKSTPDVSHSASILDSTMHSIVNESNKIDNYEEDSLSIETASTDSINSQMSRLSTRSSTRKAKEVITETSSDDSAQSNRSTRRSRRKIMKKIR